MRPTIQKILTPLQIEWRKLHDLHGHLSFPEMDRLIERGVLPSKFACLRGQHVLCPSSIFGKMWKRPWRSK